MLKKLDLYTIVENRKSVRLKELDSELGSLIAEQADKDFIALCHNQAFAPLQKTAKKLFAQMEQLDTELLEYYNLRRECAVAMYDRVTTYNDWLDGIRDRVRVKASSEAITAKRKEMNAVGEEYRKLNAYIKTHTATQSVKFLKELGFDLEEPQKNEVEVVNINKELL